MPDSPGAGGPASWWQRHRDAWWMVFGAALCSGLLVWAALPPLRWSLVGWVAPLGWLWLIQRQRLPGRHPYASIYLASALIWALTMQGIRLAHWANYLGLVALALYLGIYLPMFIAVARSAHHQWRIPLIIAAPVAWVGVEVARGYGPLGFSMALLGHTQVRHLSVIQIADLFGPYTVSFVVMFVAACAARMLPAEQRRATWWPAIPCVLLLALTLTYGQVRLDEAAATSADDPLRVALIQGAIDTRFDGQDHSWEMLEQYRELTEQACREYQPLDLVVWPETMFPVSHVVVSGMAHPDGDALLNRQMIADNQIAFQQLVENQVRRLQPYARSAHGKRGATSWLFGAPAWELEGRRTRRYNAAILAGGQGELIGWYYKMHPVIFGEYVPFGDTFPALYHLFPLPNGLTPGTRPAVWQVNGMRLSPSICFESTMPHLIRWQVTALSRQGTPPDVLVNLTNDGWFWGSSILDMQLNCATLRAVELRRPFLVAANTGFSAWIDGNGTLRAVGPRRATGCLLAEVVPDGRSSLYSRWGDAPALACTWCSIVVLLAGIWKRRRRRVLAP